MKHNIYTTDFITIHFLLLIIQLSKRFNEGDSVSKKGKLSRFYITFQNMVELTGEDKIAPGVQEGIIIASSSVSHASMSYVDPITKPNAVDKDKEAAEKAKFLGEGPLGKTIWKLTWPDFIGKIVQALYVMVDAIFIGNMAGNNQKEKSLALASCTLAMPIDQLFHGAIGIMIGVGSSAIYGQNLGKGDTKTAKAVIGNMYFLCVLFGILYPIIGYNVLDYLLVLAGASEKEGTLALAHLYLLPMVFLSCFTFFAFAHNSTIRGEGNSNFSATIMVLGAIINIILDPILIRATGNSVLGAAIATMSGNILSTIMGMYYFFTNKGAVRLQWSDFIPQWKIIKAVLSVGVSGIITNASSSIVNILMNNLLLKYSNIHYNTLQVTEILGVVGGCGKFGFFCFMPMLSLSHACLPIYAYCYGAKRFNRFLNTMKIHFLAEILVGFLLVILGSFSGSFLAGLFSQSLYFKQLFTEGLRYVTCGIFFNAFVMSIFPPLQGTGRGVPSAFILFFKQLLFLLSFAYLFCAILNNWWGNMWAYPLAEIAGAALALGAFFIYKSVFEGKKE